jgi:hypothetical protein
MEFALSDLRAGNPSLASKAERKLRNIVQHERGIDAVEGRESNTEAISQWIKF